MSIDYFQLKCLRREDYHKLRKEQSRGVHKHKKTLLIAEASVVAVVGTVSVVKNWEAIEGLLTHGMVKGEIPALIEEAEDSISLHNKIVDIREHIRQLPKGQHASARKIVEATEDGVLLEPDQTFVSAYSRSYVA